MMMMIIIIILIIVIIIIIISIITIIIATTVLLWIHESDQRSSAISDERWQRVPHELSHLDVVAPWAVGEKYMSKSMYII